MLAMKKKRVIVRMGHVWLCVLITQIIQIFSDAFTSWDFADPGEAAPLRVSNSKTQQTTLLGVSLLYANQPFQSPPTSFTEFLPVKPPSPCPKHPRVRCQTTKGSRLLTLPHPFLPLLQPQLKFLLTFSSYPFYILTNPGASPCGPVWHGMLPPPPLGTVTNYLFNGNCLLICCPHHT